jgi:hypothetical protein
VFIIFTPGSARKLAMKLGDMLLVNPGTHVPPGGRYSQGVVLTNPTSLGFITIAWRDGKITMEGVGNVSKYYTVINSETR